MRDVAKDAAEGLSTSKEEEEKEPIKLVNTIMSYQELSGPKSDKKKWIILIVMMIRVSFMSAPYILVDHSLEIVIKNKNM